MLTFGWVVATLNCKLNRFQIIRNVSGWHWYYLQIEWHCGLSRREQLLCVLLLLHHSNLGSGWNVEIWTFLYIRVVKVINLRIQNLKEGCMGSGSIPGILQKIIFFCFCWELTPHYPVCSTVSTLTALLCLISREVWLPRFFDPTLCICCLWGHQKTEFVWTVHKVDVCMCVCVCACVRACARARQEGVMPAGEYEIGTSGLFFQIRSAELQGRNKLHCWQFQVACTPMQ
jgi:hypothetical protein